MQGFCCVALAENASFKSSGIICQSPLLSSLLDELPMDRRDSDRFFSTKLASRPSISSYSKTDLSLITPKWQLSSRSLVSQTFTHKTGRSGDINIPVAVPVECMECNFVASQTTDFACACCANHWTENGDSNRD